MLKFQFRVLNSTEHEIGRIRGVNGDLAMPATSNGVWGAQLKHAKRVHIAAITGIAQNKVTSRYIPSTAPDRRVRT